MWSQVLNPLLPSVGLLLLMHAMGCPLLKKISSKQTNKQKGVCGGGGRKERKRKRNMAFWHEYNAKPKSVFIHSVENCVLFSSTTIGLWPFPWRSWNKWSFSRKFPTKWCLGFLQGYILIPQKKIIMFLCKKCVNEWFFFSILKLELS